MIKTEKLVSFSVNEVNKILKECFEGSPNENEAKKVLTSLIVGEQASIIGLKDYEEKKSFIFSSDKIYVIGADEPIQYVDLASLKDLMDSIRQESGEK